MVRTITSLIHKLCADKNGRIAIIQKPNLPLVAWAVSRIMAKFVDGKTEHSIAQLGTAFLFLWAWLELTSGVSRIRKLLGLIVLVFIIKGYFV